MPPAGSNLFCVYYAEYIEKYYHPALADRDMEIAVMLDLWHRALCAPWVDWATNLGAVLLIQGTP